MAGILDILSGEISPDITVKIEERNIIIISAAVVTVFLMVVLIKKKV